MASSVGSIRANGWLATIAHPPQRRASQRTATPPMTTTTSTTMSDPARSDEVRVGNSSRLSFRQSPVTDAPSITNWSRTLRPFPMHRFNLARTPDAGASNRIPYRWAPSSRSTVLSSMVMPVDPFEPGPSTMMPPYRLSVTWLPTTTVSWALWTTMPENTAAPLSDTVLRATRVRVPPAEMPALRLLLGTLADAAGAVLGV